MMLSVFAKCNNSAYNAECHDAECDYAECFYAKCHGAMWACLEAADKLELLWRKKPQKCQKPTLFYRLNSISCTQFEIDAFF